MAATDISIKTSPSILALFEASPFPQLAILPDAPRFTIALASDGYLSLTQTRRESIVGRGVFEVFPDDGDRPDADGVSNLCASLLCAISTREPDALPMQRYDTERPGGGFVERYWNVLNTPVLDGNGEVVYILHTVEEVTSKVIAGRQKAAHAAEQQRIRQAQKAGGVGSFEWLFKANRIICTPEFEALYGLPEGSFQVGFDFWKRFVVPEDAARVQSEIENCLANGIREYIYEFRLLLSDGNIRWLRCQADFFYDESGAPERMIGINIDIDAQKRAEAYLRESEQRLRAIFDGTYEYIGLLTPAGTLLEANRALLDFGSNKREDLVGQAFWESPWFALTPGAPERVRQAIISAAAGEFVRFEASVRRPSGETSTFDISLHPICDEDGKVIFIVPEGRDISGHKESKDMLQRQWQIFDTALSHTPDHTYTFDLECRCLYANQALLSLWQKTLEEAIGKDFFDLGYPPLLAEKVHRQIQQVTESRQPIRDHAEFTGANGQTNYYEYIFVPVIGTEGCVEAVSGSTRDITDRNRMEKALAASEDKLRRVFAQAPVAIVVFRGRDFVVEMANPTYQALLRGRDIIGHRFADVVPELPQHVWDAFNHVLDTGEAFIANEWQTNYDADNDGVVEDHWFNVAYNPLRDLDGTVSGIIAVLTDVTAQALARKELERVNRDLEEFSYVASHDLQEPLRMVNIYTHLILKQISDADPITAKYAGFVRQGVSRMETLLGDLLTYSRAVHREMLPAEPADLKDAVSEALSVLRLPIEESSATITIGPLPAIRAETKQMAHVFQNLISNALKYRKRGTAPAIEISARQAGSEWIIAVQDNGIGFDPKYAERIFGLFKRLHRDEYPGTGLGLAICQRIITRSGGRIWAESKLGEGATFRFSLPV